MKEAVARPESSSKLPNDSSWEGSVTGGGRGRIPRRALGRQSGRGSNGLGGGRGGATVEAGGHVRGAPRTEAAISERVGATDI